MKHSISAPAGAFKNHLRWLMLLSDYYNSELKNTCLPTNLNDKISFIKEKIYPDTRDCISWLDYEWTYKLDLDKVMYIDFSPRVVSAQGKDEPQHKIITMWATPLECLLGYAKFEPGILQFKSKEEFFVQITKENIYTKNYFKNKLPNEEILLLHSYTLFNPILSRAFYNQVVDFFGVDDQYESACEIHNIWYNKQIDARKQAYYLMKDAVWPNFAWRFDPKNLLSSHPRTEDEFNRMKKMILEIYAGDI